MKHIDNFLNNITMYRLLLYVLIALNILGAVFSFTGLLPFHGIAFIISVLFLIAVSWISNSIFANVFEAHVNMESVYISALILSLLITPAKDLHGLIFLGWAATLTTASKYILAIGKKHVFNPVAISILLTSLVLGDSAVWWVGTGAMLPFVFIGGFLVVRKIKREDLVISFLVTATALTLIYNPSLSLKLFTDTPLLFFALIMLTEPLTTPPTKKLRVIYGILVGLMFDPQIRFMTPELALVIGNIFSYAVSPKEKLMLSLKQKIPIGENLYDFIFIPDKHFSCIPGQYMEWTLGHEKVDDRGNRRYFTLASSPTEHEVRLGIRFANSASSFKKTLLAMPVGSKIAAGQRAGDFVLPADPAKKLVFIAGGIGITPFRSMVKYLTDMNEKRDIVLFYSNKTAGEIVYRDIFDEAEKRIGVKTTYIVTARDGRLDATKIAREVPDYKDRLFYLSGPNTLVSAFEETLRDMGVPTRQIKTDFFPGFS
jgi:ferredoxin-NADP reductase/Na+-translocating ferredoxin:NAD+ oxidoreductase RnfD subunit